MSKELKYAFLVHAVMTVVFGALLLIIPGRFLEAIGWAPIDPIASRILGAAMLALAWSSFRGWQARERARVALLVELEAAFCILACVGMGRHLFRRVSYPAWPWIFFGLFAAWAIVWVVLWVRERK
jgi:hypothetical protein